MADLRSSAIHDNDIAQCAVPFFAAGGRTVKFSARSFVYMDRDGRREGTV